MFNKSSYIGQCSQIKVFFSGLFQTVATGSLPWSEDEIDLDYNGKFHTRLLVPLRDFLQDGIHFTVIKTKHMYVLEDPNAGQNEETKSQASAKSELHLFIIFASAC